MVYNYEYSITYTANDDDNDKYQNDMLQVFNMESFDNDIINATINKVYSLVKTNDDFLKIIKESNRRLMTEDDEIGFMGLFAFDFFLHTHHLLGEIKNGTVDLKTNKHYLKILNNA